MSRGLLGVPLGEPGSGRERYARAMELYQTGAISAAVLEAYRVAAARDAQPPEPVLAERGLPVPEVLPLAPEDTIRALIAAADLYLAGLPGPGIAEVRQGIAAARHGPVSLVAAEPNPVVDRHLPEALRALAATRPGLAAAIAAARPHLRWITYDGYPRAEIGEGFATSHAYASILGDEASLPAADFDFGLFLIAPQVLYRDHHHAAPELYAPLTGPHGWRFGPDQPLLLRPAHVPVWNPPHQPHLTKVGALPFLCLFGWTRDAQSPAQVIPARDWAELEALRLAL